MEYTVLTHIQVQQVPNDQYPLRNLLIEFSFLNKYDGASSWEDLTQTMCITLPKRVVLKAWSTTKPFQAFDRDIYQKVQLGNTNGQNSNIGGFDSAPTFMRGDMIRFNVGYRAKVGLNQENDVVYMTGGQDPTKVYKSVTDSTTGETTGIPMLFEGFISHVQPKLPFTIECEDNMWLCKQIPTKSKTYPNISLQEIVEDILKEAKGLDILTKYQDYIKLSVSDFSKTDLVFNVRNMTTTRGSLASELARWKHQFQVDSYFRGGELRIGLTHYVPDDTKEHTFTFQKNILDNDRLKWQRKDDVLLSAIVKSHYLKSKGGTTLDGKEKTTHASTEILVFNQAGEFTYKEKKKGEPLPVNDIGERFCFNVYSDITDPKKLFEMGKAMLKKRYYDGFKGSFTTFGIPYVKHGDTVHLINPALPEQDGYYKVKAVQYYGGVEDGLKQTIFLDYKIEV